MNSIPLTCDCGYGNGQLHAPNTFCWVKTPKEITVNSDFRGQLTTSSDALKFMLAGDARITIVNSDTKSRFTYRISAPSKETERGGKVRDFAANVRFVNLADNEGTFAFLGTIFLQDRAFRYSRKSRVSMAAPSVVLFHDVFKMLVTDLVDEFISIFHEGVCGRCGRTLTVPTSIASGFGPDCAALLGVDQPEPAVTPIAGGSEPVVIERPARKCWKCGGGGRFITRTGRDFGACFPCNGTGEVR
jgi:Family of unknown function (DUF6011)